MLTRVLLLRHAQSADPTVFHGAESDVSLSALGQQQALAVAPFLAAYQPVAVVASAMRRAVDTATPTASLCGLRVRVEPALHERRVGALSGTPTNRRGGPWQQTVKRWIAGDTSFASPGAESFEEIAARVMTVWGRLVVEFAGHTFAVVAHGVVCKVLLLSLLPGWSAAKWKRLGPVPNVGVSELLGGTGNWQAIRLLEVPAGVPVESSVAGPPPS
jgi:broad specificity phosphatase PhoE